MADPALQGGDGAVMYQKLLDQGHSPEDVEAWRQDQMQTMYKNGNTPDDIKKFWNLSDPDYTKLDQLVKASVESAAPEQVQSMASNPMEALSAGFQNSDFGLMAGKPNTVMPQDAGMLSKIAFGIGQGVGDLPLMVVGAVGGAALGAETGPGAVVTGGIGAAALPEAFRQVLMDHYEHPSGPFTWKDFFSRAATVALNTGKAAVVGGISAGVGGAAGGAVLRATGSKIAGAFSDVAAMATSATLTGAALDGRVPDAQDFVSGAVLALGMKGAGEFVGATRRYVPSDAAQAVTENLHDAYVATGEHPIVLGQMAQHDVVMRGEVFGPKSATGDRVTPAMDEITKREPNAYHEQPEPEETAGAEEPEAPAAKAAYTLARDERTYKSGNIRFNIHDADGNEVGSMRVGYDEDSKTITVHNVRMRSDAVGGTANRPNSIGAKNVMQLRDQLRQEFPEATSIGGVRVSGARAAADAKGSVNIAMTPLEQLQARQKAENSWEAKSDRALTAQGASPVTYPGYEETEPPKGPPKEPPPPQDGQRPLLPGPDDRINLNWQSGHEQVMDIVGAKAKDGFLPAWLNPRRWFASFQAQLTPARTLDRKVGLDPKQVGIEDMYRQTYASRERAGLFFQHGTVRPGGNSYELTSDDSFKAAYQAVKEDGGTMDGFMSYRLAKRTVEKAGQGVETGVPLESAQLRLTEPGVEAKYARGNAIMQRTKNASLDYATDAQMFTPEGAEAMKELNQYHVVFRRMIDPDYMPPKPGRSFNVKDPTRTMKGGDSKIVDPVTADFDNLHTMIAMSDRNMAKLNLLGRFNEFNQQQVRLGREATFDLNKVEARDMDLNRPIEGAELQDANGNPIPEADARAAFPFIVQRRFNGARKAGQFLVFDHGQPVVWETSDPDIAEVMNMTFAGKAPPIAEALQKFAGLQRAGISTRPLFAMRSLFHQQFGGAVAGEGGGAPWANFIRGLPAVVTKNELWQRAMANGAVGQSMSDMDDNFIRRNVADIFDKTNTWDSVRNIAQHPFDAWRGLLHMLHSASTVGAFDRMENQGFSSLKAAMSARTNYLDHAEPLAASWATQFSRMVPFMTTGIKDWEQFGRAMQDRPFSTIAKGMAYLTLPTVLNAAANHLYDQHNNTPEGQRYIDLPEWRRVLFWNLPPINGIRIPIPKPYVLGAIFTIPAEMASHFLMTSRGFDSVARDLLAQYVPPFVPAVATPIAEDKFNTDFLTGRPLVPDQLEKADGYMQYFPDSTSPVMRKLSAVLGKPGMNLMDMSPIVTENYIRQWAGPLGMSVLNALDMPFKDPGPPKTWADNPLIGSFIAREGGAHSQVFETLYNKLDEFDKAHADFQEAQKHLNPDELQQTSQDQRAFVDTKTIRDGLREQAAALQAIYHNKDMSDADKLKMGDSLTAGMVRSAESSLQMLERFK